ncbi:sensor histidine kinase [Nonlabens xiamenensis]|uniref:sensor histidine kinase n=1 Tax=Nonlabens xiamenensis TaxID=2341043 RepID=UPI000F60C92D|nr:HAMP domain-containing sensor histidine kinase [Nonlabens xiamenensis]
MNDRKYHFLFVLISVVIAAVLAMQIYWNYKNFQESEKQLLSELQVSLDQSVEEYYTEFLETEQYGIIVEETTNRMGELSTFFKRLDSINKRAGYRGFDLNNVNVSDISEIRIFRGADMSDLNEVEPMEGLWNLPNYDISQPEPTPNFTGIKSQTFFSDSQNLNETIRELTSKVIFSIQEPMNLEQLDSIFSRKLENRDIKLDYSLQLIEKDIENPMNMGRNKRIKAQSELVGKGKQLSLDYNSLSRSIFDRNLTGVILSGLLIASVVLCLFYLLQIIRKQKALGEMKNDLISNITHEFKTPIATASVALEGVQSFTDSGDLDKTSRYLSMGREQLSKLNGMVERILETATLDSRELMLQKSEVALVDLVEAIITRSQSQTKKEIQWTTSHPEIIINADAFHLENAINNLLDNAIKYGGELIHVSVNKLSHQTSIEVTDNGAGLSAKDARLIFDKFYRVGKGNRHDVKGFGIGLFYTKSIIEKHNGTISVAVQPKTTFKITLPNE